MRKLIFPILAAIAVLAGCSEDFEVSAPYKDVTVVYGIFNEQDTAHYIRIQKAYLDEHKSAVEMAKVADSNFHSQLEVTLREIANGKVINTIPADLVDLNLEGIGKLPGSFFTAPNWGYKFKRDLNHNYRYRVVMLNKATGNVDSAETGIVNSDTTNTPGNFYIADFSRNNFEIILTNTLASGKFFLPINVPNNSRIFEGWIRFKYVDKNAATNVQTDKFVDWRFTTATVPEGVQRVTLEVSVNEAHNFLIDAMGPAPGNIARFMDSCDVYVYAGSDELYTYQQVKLGQTGGLTGDQIKPNYTNVQGDNVLGLVASRAMRISYNVPFSTYTIDTFRTRAIMQPLNIQGRSDH